MNKSYSLDELRRVLTLAQNVFVLLPVSPLFDQVASALALYLSLGKQGKQVSVLAPDEMVVEFSHLVGVDKIGNKLPGGELILTVNLPIENIEKVSSNENEGKLSLAIRPKPGLPPVGKEDIIFSSTGAAADLLFLIEPKKLESLGKIYQENKVLFEQKPNVNLNHYPKAEPLGQINVIDPAASCLSEIMTALIEGLSLPVDEDISGNLLLGLKNATDNFQNQSTTAETFEAAAFCLRQGAGKTPMAANSSLNPQQAPSPDWFEPKIYKGSTLP